MEIPTRMKRFNTLLPVITAVFFFAACGDTASTNQTVNTNARAAATATPAPSAPAATPDELAAARATYAQFCIRCHKPDGSGGIFELEDGKKLKVPNLREGHALKDSDEEFAEQIMDGGDGMPAFKGRLEPERINALVRFIRQEFQGQTSSSGKAAPSPAR